MTEGKLRKLLDTLNVSVVHKNHRGWLVCSCPFAPFLHEYGTDRNPSFTLKVNEEGYSGFNCFTCHQKGNLTYLINRLGSLRGANYSKLAISTMLDETPESFKDFDEAMEVEYPVGASPVDKMLYLRMYPLAWEDKRSREYLIGRDISERTASLLDLRFDPDEFRILFPVYDSERSLYGFTGRTILPKDDWPAVNYGKVRDYAGLRKELLILGEHLIEDGKPILLVEGLFALAAMVEIGVCEFASPCASMGSYLSDAQRDVLVSYGEPVYLLYDDDKAGLDGLLGTSSPSGKHQGGGAIDKLKGHVPAFVCLYPEDADDPDYLTLEEVRAMVTGDMNESAEIFSLQRNACGV